MNASPLQIRKCAAENHVLVFDNVDRSGSVKASHITDLTDSADHPQAVILVRSACSTAALTDSLANRSLVVTMQALENVSALHTLNQEFAALHPKVLGALCTVASQVLRNLDTVQAPDPLVRVADATLLALAAAPALALDPVVIVRAAAEVPLPFRTFPKPPSPTDIILAAA